LAEVKYILSADNKSAIVASEEVKSAFKSLGTQSIADIQRAKSEINASYESLRKSGKLAPEEIKQAWAAKNARIKELDQQMLSDQTGIGARLKENWLGVTAAIGAAWITVQKAWGLASMAADFQEQKNALNSFAAQYHTTASQIIDDIKDITNGQIALVDIAKISTKALALDVPLDKYKELAKYADAVGDALGMNTTQALEALAEASEKGVERQMKQIVGLVDLDQKYGKLTDRMSEHEKIQKRVELMLEKLKEKYGDLSGSTESTRDKMEKLTATVKNLELWMGTALIRAAAGVMSVFQGVASAALYLSAGVFKIISGISKLTDLLGITSGQQARWALESEAAMGAAGELAGKAKDNFEAMIAPSKELSVVMRTTRNEGEASKKWLDDMAAAMKEWNAKTLAATASTNELDQELIRITGEADKLRQKWGNQKWIDEGMVAQAQAAADKYFAGINAGSVQAENEFKQFWKDIEIAQKIGIDKITAAEEKWLDDTITQYGVNEEAVAKIIEESNNRKLRAIDDYNSKAEQEYLDSLAGLLPAYEEATDLVRIFGETDLEYTERILSEKKKWVPLLQEVQTYLEKTGDTGSEAYKAITKELTTLSEVQKQVNATFADGWDQGIKEWVEETRDGFAQGKEFARDFANEGTNAIEEMIKGNENAFKNFGDFLKNWLIHQIATFAMNPIMVQMQSIFSGGTPGAPSGSGFSLPGLGGFDLQSLVSWIPGFAPSSAGLQGPTMANGSFFSQGFSISSFMQDLGPLIAEATIFKAIGDWIGGKDRPNVGTNAMIGTLIGGPIGGLIGGLIGWFDKVRPPAMDLNWTPGQIPSHIGEGWEGTSFQGERGRMEVVGQHGIDPAITGPIAKGFSAMADKMYEAANKFGFDLSGFAKTWTVDIGDMTGMSQEQIEATMKAEADEFAKSLVGPQVTTIITGIQRNSETFVDALNRLFAALDAAPELAKGIDTYINIIQGGYGPLAAYNDQMAASRKTLNELVEAGKKATDPTDVANYEAQITKALYDRYKAEEDMIHGLQAAIAQAAATARRLAVEMGNFKLGIQQQIDQLQGTHTAAGAIESKLPQARALYAQAATPQERVELINQGVTYVNAWLQSKTDEINARYDALEADIRKGYREWTVTNPGNEAVIQPQIDAVNLQLRAIEGWKSLLQSLNSTIVGLQTSTANPADIFQRMGIGKAEVERLQNLFNTSTGEDRVAAAGQLQTAVTDYLKLVQEAGAVSADYQRPGGQYGAEFKWGMGLLTALKGTATVESDAAKQTALQEQLVSLQSQLVKASTITMNNQAEIDSRLAAAESQRAAEIKDVNTTAVGYLQWLRDEGAAQYAAAIAQVQVDKATAEAAMIAVTGGLDPDAWLAQKQQEAVTNLTALKSWADDYWTNLRDSLSAIPAPVVNVEVNVAGGTASSPFGAGFQQGDVGDAEGATYKVPTFIPRHWVAERRTEHILDNQMLVGVVQEAMDKRGNSGSITYAPSFVIHARDNQTAEEIWQTVEEKGEKSMESGRWRKAVQKVQTGR
jgi:hypothetical protein